MKCLHCGSANIGWEPSDDWERDWFYCDDCGGTFSGFEYRAAHPEQVKPT